MNNMRPPKKRNVDWEYKKTSIQDIDPDSQFQIYLLAQPKQLKKFYIEEVAYFWVHHQIQQRKIQQMVNKLSNQLDIKTFPYVGNLLDALEKFKENFKIICEVQDLQQILKYHSDNKKLICIHIFDLNLKKNPLLVRNKKIELKSDQFQSFKRMLSRKNLQKNSIDTFTNSTRITNWDIAQVNQSRLALKTLLISKNDKKGKSDFISLATIVQQDHGKVGEYEGNYKLNSSPQEAIKWYTKQSFYHRLVNNTLKTGKGNPLLLSYVRFPVKQLYNAIKTLYNTKDLHRESFQCYRGGRINEAQLDYFRKNKKGFIEMQGFLSCSKSKAQMSEFIVNCVFKIIVGNLNRDPQWDHGFCFLDTLELTQFIKEQEVLFNIFSVMQIKDVTKQVYNNHEVDVISLEYGSLASLLYQKKHNLTLKDVKYSQICIRNYQSLKPYYDSINNQVDVFRFFGKYKQVQDYYVAQIQFLQRHKIKDKNKLFQAILHLGNNNLSLKQYVKSKQYLQKAKQLAQQNKSIVADQLILSKIQNGLGIANKNLNKIIESKNNYLKTIKLIQKSRNRNGKIYLATAYNNLAAILVEQNQQKQALQYYEKALNLLQDQENQTIANVHYNIGLYNLKKHNYKQAIKNFIRSLQIYNKIFGTHKDTINCNIKLGQAYLKDGSSKQVYDRYFYAGLDMMKNLAFSSRDQYIEIKRQIQDIKQKHRKTVQRSVSRSVNSYQASDVLSYMQKKDEVDKYMDKNKTQRQRQRIKSDYEGVINGNKRNIYEEMKSPYINSIIPTINNSMLNSNEVSPVINKGYNKPQQKLRQMRAQNILGDDNPFSYTKNLTSNLQNKIIDFKRINQQALKSKQSKNTQFLNKDIEFINKDKLYQQIMDNKLLQMSKNQSGLMNSSRYSPSLNNLPVINTNINSMNNNNGGINNNIGGIHNNINNNNNKNAVSLNNIGSMMGDNFYNDVYNKIKEGRKKRVLIFG